MSATLTTQHGLDLARMPAEDLLAWGRTPPNAQDEICRWLGWCEEIRQARHGQTGAVVASVAVRAGMSAAAVRRKYDAWRKDGWQALRDCRKYKVGAQAGALPPEFVRHWHSLLTAYQRDTTGRAAHKALQRQLAAWERGDESLRIPGYDRPPQRLRSNGWLPAGWSESNLVTRNGLDEYAEALAKRGSRAAAAFLPAVRASRVGMLPRQLYFFDDETPDVDVNFDGNSRAMRPFAFHVLDYASAYNAARNYQPAIIGDDGKKKQLTSEVFCWFVVHVLTELGYRTDTGTVLAGEHGTAKIPERMVEALHIVTGGKVTCDVSGTFGDPAFRGMLYGGQRTGNFRFKGPLESFFNPYRNAMAMLPGATGRNRDCKPEEQVGMLRANERLLAIAERMPAEHRMQLVLPQMRFGMFVRRANDIIQLLNERTDHELGQWEACDYVGTEFSLDGGRTWQRVKAEDLADPRRAEVIHGLNAFGYVRTSNLSPLEVWERHGRDGAIRRLPHHLIPSVLPVDLAREAKVTPRLEFVIEDLRIDTEPLVYPAQAECERGHTIKLSRGETYLVYVNPFHPSLACVCLAHGPRRGELIGVLRRWTVPSRGDREAILENFGRVQGLAAHDKADVERMVHSEILRRQGDKSFNERLVDDAKKAPGQRRYKAAGVPAAEETEAVLSALLSGRAAENGEVENGEMGDGDFLSGYGAGEE